MVGVGTILALGLAGWGLGSPVGAGDGVASTAGASIEPQPQPDIDDIDDVSGVEPDIDDIDDVSAVEPDIDEIDDVSEIEPDGDDIDDVSEPEPEPEPVGVETSSVPQGPPSPLTPLEVDEDLSPPSSAQRLRALADHVNFGGFIQVDFLRKQISEDELSDGTREPLNETAFVLRNARVGVDADWKWVGSTAYAELFSNGQGVRPATFDLHAQIPRKGGGAPWVRLRAGLLRVPFGFENSDQNDAQRFFGERALVSHAFVPGLFDVGASLSGQLWALRWILAVHNGQPVGAPGFGYRDPNAAKDYAGRLHLRGKAFEWLDGALGFSFLTGTGFSAGTPPTKDGFDWVDLNEDGRVTVAEILPITGTAGRPSENFSRWGLAVDTQLRAPLPRVGELMLYSEVAVGKNLDRAIAIADPVLLRRDQRGLGWYVGLTQQLTRHATIGVRYDEYHPDLDRLEPYDGTVVITRRRFRSVTAGAAGHLYQGEAISARLLVEYEHQRNSLGRDPQGRPAQLDNDTLRVRAELVF